MIIINIKGISCTPLNPPKNKTIKPTMLAAIERNNISIKRNLFKNLAQKMTIGKARIKPIANKAPATISILSDEPNIIVLNHGSLMAEGKPDTVLQNKDVREAYLGV